MQAADAGNGEDGIGDVGSRHIFSHDGSVVGSCRDAPGLVVGGSVVAGHRAHLP